jgi:hypothetical protein
VEFDSNLKYGGIPLPVSAKDMSLRAYFAGQVIPCLTTGGNYPSAKILAQCAVELADALLAELAK